MSIITYPLNGVVYSAEDVATYPHIRRLLQRDQLCCQ